VLPPVPSLRRRTRVFASDAALFCALCAQLSLDADLQDCESRLLSAVEGLAQTAYPLLVAAREALGYRREETTRIVPTDSHPGGGTREVGVLRLVRDESDEATAHALLGQLDQLVQRIEDAQLGAILDRTAILYQQRWKSCPLPLKDEWLVSLAAALCWHVAKSGGSIVEQEARLASLQGVTSTILPRDTVDAVWSWRRSVMTDPDCSLDARARTILLMDDVLAEATEATSGGTGIWSGASKRQRVSVTVGFGGVMVPGTRG